MTGTVILPRPRSAAPVSRWYWLLVYGRQAGEVWITGLGGSQVSLPTSRPFKDLLVAGSSRELDISRRGGFVASVTSTYEGDQTPSPVCSVVELGEVACWTDWCFTYVQPSYRGCPLSSGINP